jgi:hypothetical protein
MDGETTSDVAADLTHPHLLAMVVNGAQPEPQVIALMNVVAGFLQREILSSTFRRPLFELTGSAFHRTTEDVWRQAA